MQSEVSVQEFIELFYANDKDVSSVKVNGTIKISGNNFVHRKNLIEIRKCELDVLVIDGTEIDGGKIKDLVLTIDNCQIQSLHISFVSINTVRIEGKSTINKISIGGSNFQSIYFFQNTVTSFEIENCEIQKTNFSTSEIVDFKIEDTITSEHLSLSEIKSKKILIKDHQTKVSISHCVFDELLIQLIGYDLTDLYLGSNTGKKLNIRNSQRTIDYVHFISNEIEQITFETTFVNKMYLDNLKSSLISISGEVNDYLKLYNSAIGNLFLSNLRQSNNELNLKGSTIKHLYLQRLKREENSITTFNEIEIEESLFLEDSYLPNIRLNNVDLTNANLHLHNTVLTGSEFINVRWKDYSIYENTKEAIKTTKNRIGFLWSLKEQYRQLKVLSINQHNKIDAVSFQRNELRIYLNLLTLLTWRNGLKSFRKNFGNWLILVTNKLFSNFGQSWLLPLVWWLGLHGLLFCLMLRQYPLGVEFGIGESTSFEATYRASKLFLELIFPVHNKEVLNVYTSETVKVWGWLDFTMRVIAPYFIFYFIRGTRKYNLSI